MGKLFDRLQKQLNTEYKEDAEDCLKIYTKLKEMTDHVWTSQWQPLVTTIFKDFPSDERRSKPTSIGYIFLKGMNNEDTI
jgi:hypothetical protein